MHRPLLLAIAAWFAVLALSPLPAVAQTAAGPPAGRPDPEFIRKSCDEGARHVADWNLRAAKSAYLRAAWIAQEHHPDHALRGRAYLGLAEVTLLRRELWSINYFREAHDRGALDATRAAAVAESLAFLLFSPRRYAGPDPQFRLGGKLFRKLSDDFRKRLAGFGWGRMPRSAADGARLATLAASTSDRVAGESSASRYLALAALDRALELHRIRLGSSCDPGAAKTAANLAAKVSERAAVEAKLVRAAARRLAVKDNAAGVPDNPSLAFALGETRRMRWRAEQSNAGHAKVAEACYRVALAAEPDHAGAARGLVEILLATDRRDQATDVAKSLVRALHTPARAWSGKPEGPAAPRYIRASDAIELQADDAGEDDARAWAKRLSAWADDAQIEPYLAHGPVFHPEDVVGSSVDLRAHLENNVGLALMARWDLTRAERRLRLCVASDGPDPMRLVTIVSRGHQNLGNLFARRGDFDRAIEHYRLSVRFNPNDMIAHNNLGALLGIYGSITRRIELIEEGVSRYARAIELAPQYVYGGKSSLRFMRNVHRTWVRYEAGDRSRPVVWSYANSFLFAARSLAEDEAPDHLKAMRILDSGLRALPDDEEMVEIYGPTRTAPGLAGRSDALPLREQMTEVFNRCYPRAVRTYEGLLQKYGADNPHLNFCLAESHRLAWRQNDATRRDPAEAAYEKTLAGAPDHVPAVLGLVELLRSQGKQDEAVRRLDAVVAALMKPWRGTPAGPERLRSKDALELIEKFEVVEDPAAPFARFRLRAVDSVIAAQRAHAEKHLGGKDAEAWNNLGFALITAARLLEDDTRLEQALPPLDRAMQLDPSRYGPALNKIHALRKLNRHLEAERLRHQMHEQFPQESRFVPTPWDKGRK